MPTLFWKDIPNFAFKVHVQAFVRNAAYLHATLRKLAQDIFDKYIKGKDFAPALQAYIDVCYTIDGVKMATIGKNASTERSNTLMQVIAAIFAREAYMNDSHIAIIDDYIKSLEGLSGTPTWFFPKLKTLKLFAEAASRADWLAGSIMLDPKFGSGMMSLIQDSMAQVNQQIADMMRELAALRKYGVKSSFFQDGMLHQPSQAWVFMDFHDVQAGAPAWSNFRDKDNAPLALVSLADRDSLKSISVETAEDRLGEGHILGIRTSFGSHAWAVLDADGELDASLGLGVMPLRTFFERRNNAAFYELLRYAQAIRLYDLVVPLTTVEKMPQPPVSKGTLERLKSIFTHKHLLSPDLIVPRLRSLENVDQLVRELEQEIEQADAETVERAKRELRRHEVIYHVRRLPKGKHPTAEARARAEKYNIVLADNETFVKPHERGKGNLEPVAHRAKARPNR